MKIALLQCYSASNLGDGLLVEESVALLHDAFGPNIEITLVASYPETFVGFGAHRVQSRPMMWGYDVGFLRTIARLHTFDLVVGVGGGYLRFGTLREAFTTTLVHMPQLMVAVTRARASLYLPQSVGPAPAYMRGLLGRLMSRVDLFLVRDDRSLNEFPKANFTRCPDLALLVAGKRQRDTVLVERTPVYTIRPIRGEVLPGLVQLGAMLGDFTGYIQSRGAGNDDTDAMAKLNPRQMIEHEELFDLNGIRRVVIAVRLHAALMAVNAGHYVIHLAYERKGFGAFSDLDLPEYVHNVRSFDVGAVYRQAHELLTDMRAREDYDERLRRSFARLAEQRVELIERVRKLPSL